ncbi:OLC1v1032148C1 [Oldenlandia corymbosa var. corymbosa]|uniref:OLC1v1032148C1 n=1 Tax=Oldenlandia corymbosa var. corymbosa TaxID=529605 RepID=A0AAV1CNG4_OLDCO|nr:OLC1v1032148C1 [Oldenlandia corymbosa var. corymbosa]
MKARPQELPWWNIGNSYAVHGIECLGDGLADLVEQGLGVFLKARPEAKEGTIGKDLADSFNLPLSFIPLYLRFNKCWIHLIRI